MRAAFATTGTISLAKMTLHATRVTNVAQSSTDVLRAIVNAIRPLGWQVFALEIACRGLASVSLVQMVIVVVLTRAH